MADQLISPSKVKAFALAASKKQRGGKFTRVGQSFLDEVEARTRTVIEELVKQHPSVGVTLQSSTYTGKSSEK